MHQRAEAIELIGRASQVVVAKGKKVVSVDRKTTELSEEEILKLVLGPTGNLRAPTIVSGKTMIVGFNGEMFAQSLG